MAHVHELYDFTVTAYIVHDRKILLVDHKKINAWLAPGGHVELDEHPEHALWREIKEETGLDKTDLALINTQKKVPKNSDHEYFLTLPDPFAMFVVDYDGKTAHKHIDMCYLLRSTTNKVTHQAEESNGIGWFDKAELEQLHAQKKMFIHSYNYAVFAIDYFNK